jgi:hypothetical protein
MTTDRSYFKVLSDILLGPGLASINSYQPIVQKLVNKVGWCCSIAYSD